MNVVVVHPSLNRVGGAEKVCLDLLDLFTGLDHPVVLFTIDKVRWDRLQTGPDFRRPDAEVYFLEGLSFLESLPIRWVVYGLLYLVLLIVAKRHPDSLSINNYGDFAPFISDISYVHSKPLLSCSVDENPYNIPLWFLLSGLYRLFILLLGKTFKISTIVTNSKYNSFNIVASYNKKPVIIHPAARIKGTVEQFPKESMFMTLSRFSPKKLETIHDILVNEVCHGTSFVLAGSITEYSAELITDLLETFHGSKLELCICQNPSRELIDLLMSLSPVYLSTQRTEAFGLAILEAMSHGSVPVVPRDGGPWHDILDEKEGAYGFAYDRPQEAAEIIHRIVSDEPLLSELSERSKARARRFDTGRFNRAFHKLVMALEDASQTVTV